MNSSEETFDDDPFSFQGLKRKRISSPNRTTKPSQAAATPSSRAKRSKAASPRLKASQSKVATPRARASKSKSQSKRSSLSNNNNNNRKVGTRPVQGQIKRLIGAVMPGFEKSPRKPIPYKPLRKDAPTSKGKLGYILH